MELSLNKSELAAPNMYSYLFDAVAKDINNSNVNIELYKDSNSQLWFELGGAGRLFNAAELTNALNALGNDIKVRIEWPVLKLSIMNSDGSNEQVAINGGGSPPVFSFDNASKMYVGSRENGAVSTEMTTLGDPLQFNGKIKSIKIIQ